MSYNAAFLNTKEMKYSISIYKEIFLRLASSSISRNVGWSFLGSLSIRLIVPLFSIFIARLLLPQDYGTFGIAASIIAFFSMFGDLGLSQAIIAIDDKKDYKNIQFTIQLIISAFSYTIIFAFASLAESIYHVHNLSIALKIMGLTFIMSIFYSPIDTQVKKKMEFKFLFVRKLVAPIISGAIALWMAFSGCGVYSLITNYVLTNAAGGIFMYAARPWKPKLEWHPEIIKKLLRFCMHFTFQKICGYFVLRTDALVIGKNLGAIEVGLYRMGQTVSNMISDMLLPQIEQVAYSDFSKNQHSARYVYRRYMQFLVSSLCITISASIGMYFLCPYLVPFILGQKWISIVPYVKVFSLPIAIAPFAVFNPSISRIWGFQQLYSYYSFIYGIAMVVGLIVASMHSLMTVAIIWAIITGIDTISSPILFFIFQDRIKPNKLYFYALIAAWSWILLAVWFIWRESI
jgi:O-antigen/teichoic acid export membrane protein